MDEAMKQIINEANEVTAQRIELRAAAKQLHRDELEAFDKVTKALEASSRTAMRKHAAEKAKENTNG